MTDRLLSSDGQAAREERGKKGRARAAAGRAKRSGKITNGPCTWRGESDREGDPECGRLPTDMHHDDYDEPLGTRDLCRPHHARAHAHVKHIAVPPVPAAGSTVSMRRFRNDPATLSEPVRVIREVGGERIVVGYWFPAWMVESE